jgi:gliding motility-associated-like protein
VPTRYYVTLTDQFGCKKSDSVFVNVKLVVTLDAGPDTSICLTDLVRLNPVSDALHYKWTPAAVLNSDTAKYPVANITGTTKFYVIANIGKCQSTDSVNVRVAPYPPAAAGADTTICFGDVAQLHASGGTIYTWSPAFYLNRADIPNPTSNPNVSIQYIVTVRDTLGCPKPVTDTVVVRVYPRIFADAGPRDTSIVLGQALLLSGSGAPFYLWSPPTALSNPNIKNPVAINLTQDINYVLKAFTAAGCFATDTISVRVYKIKAGLYVPNAFTPGGDGLNDVFMPIPIGMKRINYFKVFNRWGQLMFSTTEQMKGWDGRYKGVPQDPAVYVWIVEGVDYADNKITDKGTMTLIR